MSEQIDPTSAKSRPAGPAPGLGGKYMTFRLAGEDYGVEILKVRELVGLLEITRVPGSRPFVKGVVNLRGKVVPVVDLRVKFGLPAADLARPVIAVVQIAGAAGPLTLGLLVDEVLEVRALADAEVEPPPSLGEPAGEAEFIRAVGKAGRRVLFLLDIDRILTGGELAQLPTPEAPQA